MRPIDYVLRILLAAGLGAALGLEREYHKKPAGLRTNILIAVGVALFTIVSVTIGGGTPDRIASTVVTGIGFLGAGAIMRGRGRENVHGMTTAATIWVNAAIGMAAGIGEYRMAALATGLTLVVLELLVPLEKYFDDRAGKKDYDRY